MIRTLFLLLAWFVAVPAFSQGKPASPSTQEQLLELRLEQQHLKEKLDDQKASLEEKFEVKKENLNYQKEQMAWWLNILGVFLTFVGITLPVFGFIYGRKIAADIKKQKVAVDADLLKLNSWMDEKRKEIEEKCKLMDDWMDGKKKKVEDRLNELVNVASKQVSNSDASSSENLELSNKAKEIEKSPDATSFQKVMAKALELYFTGKYEESIKQHLLILDEYKSELTLEQLPDFYFRLAYSYGVLKDVDNTILYYEKGLNLNKNNAFAWMNLGNAYSNLGEYDIAILKYNEAIRLLPDYAEVWNNLGNAYNNDKKKDYDTAIEKYNVALKLKPNLVEAWCNLGNTYGNKSDYKNAIDKYNEAIRLKPDYSIALANLAELLIIQNENAEETLSKLKAVEKTKDDEFNTLLLGTIWKVKSKTDTGSVDNVVVQLKQTVGGDNSNVVWDFKILNDWLAREKANPSVLDEKARVFITDLIQRIEEWRGSQPKAE